jgi:hypothetical protein
MILGSVIVGARLVLAKNVGRPEAMIALLVEARIAYG